MAILIGTAEPGFDNPVGLLTACHRRIERFLGTLSRVANGRAGGPLEVDERQALEVALRYFRDAAPHHTADEEHDLFPALESAEPGTCTAVESLRSDHRRAEQLHAEVERIGREWLQEGIVDEHKAASMRQALEDLTELYRKHIRIEEQQVFPRAAQCLPAAVLQSIGRQMADRRGAVYMPPSVVSLGDGTFKAQ